MAFDRALMMEPFLLRMFDFMCSIFVVDGAFLGAREFDVRICPTIPMP